MKSLWFSIALLVLVSRTAMATFSIVAVDTVTQEVGGAGASCIPNCLILNDLHPGIGGIHTQAYYESANQRYAAALMNAGVPPHDIIDSLVAHDVVEQPWFRQYGIVDLVSGGRSAAYTGDSCTSWAGDSTGRDFSAQGNILLGEQIVDSLVSAFRRTQGALVTRLHAALDAARTPGADTRCLSFGKSAISAFVRVMRPDDPQNDPYCSLVVANTAGSTDPIDVLDSLYQVWMDEMADTPDSYTSTITIGRDTILANGTDTTAIRVVPRNNQGVHLGPDISWVIWSSSATTISDPVYQPADSSYIAVLVSQPVPMADTVTIASISGHRDEVLVTRPVVHYVNSSAASPHLSLPREVELHVFPTPFNSTAVISLGIPVRMRTEVKVFDLLGRDVAALQSGMLEAGSHTLRWNASRFASGLYFVRVNAGSETRIRKIMLLK